MLEYGWKNVCRFANCKLVLLYSAWTPPGPQSCESLMPHLIVRLFLTQVSIPLPALRRFLGYSLIGNHGQCITLIINPQLMNHAFSMWSCLKCLWFSWRSSSSLLYSMPETWMQWKRHTWQLGTMARHRGGTENRVLQIWSRNDAGHNGPHFNNKMTGWSGLEPPVILVLGAA